MKCDDQKKHYTHICVFILHVLSEEQKGKKNDDPHHLM